MPRVGACVRSDTPVISRHSAEPGSRFSNIVPPAIVRGHDFTVSSFLGKRMEAMTDRIRINVITVKARTAGNL